MSRHLRRSLRNSTRLPHSHRKRESKPKRRGAVLAIQKECLLCEKRITRIQDYGRIYPGSPHAVHVTCAKRQLEFA